jgi:hypothetical protein
LSQSVAIFKACDEVSPLLVGWQTVSGLAIGQFQVVGAMALFADRQGRQLVAEELIPFGRVVELLLRRPIHYIVVAAKMSRALVRRTARRVTGLRRHGEPRAT